MKQLYIESTHNLTQKIMSAKASLGVSAAYYDALYRPKAVGLAVPEKMRLLLAHCGWPRVYVGALEERLDVEGFRIAGMADQIDELWEWWQANDLDEESGLVHVDAFIYGRSYVTVAAPGDDDPDIPLIRAESPLNMAAERDPRTGKLTKVLRHYATDSRAQFAKATLYLPDETVFLRKSDKTPYGAWELDGEYGDPIIEHGLGEVPVVQFTNRARVADREGVSEISPEIRSITDAASRILMNMQGAAELMAIPQRYFFGVSPEKLAPNGTKAEAWEAYIGNIIAIDEPEGKAGQFQAAELRNYVEALGELAKHMTSYTGLTPEHYGITSDNPASADAIRMAENRLVKRAERKARTFGGAWESVMRLAMRVMGEQVPSDWSRLETVWRDPSTPTFSAKADAVQKLRSDGTLNTEYARIELGYGKETRADMRKWDDKDRVQSRLDALMGAPSGKPIPSPAKAAEKE